MAAEQDHAVLAEELRRRVTESGVLAGPMRLAVLSAGAGDDITGRDPYVVLARTIGEASYRVTDEMISDVRAATGSDRAAFEVVMSASIGAALRRWDAALAAIEEASDAAR
ncbi:MULTISPECIES: hypothetical protein [unclassified Microbacterium]|uniref:hypothetical protein n=1 Tax=unclassified Microbacterium TaxID=2609290 RepID=UPI0012FCF6DC|nr:hypothetical protein [Microbacterium sp. MAH-37]MVQ43977.1 hypothetical protein [Microbacterium sp. MAH-37]